MDNAAVNIGIQIPVQIPYFAYLKVVCVCVCVCVKLMAFKISGWGDTYRKGAQGWEGQQPVS